MDAGLKKRIEKLFTEIGMNTTTAFTVFAKAAVRQWKIPFEIAGDPFYSEANQTRLSASIAALNAGKGTPHELFNE
jgi:DNA-damage-inducible protein J